MLQLAHQPRLQLCRPPRLGQLLLADRLRRLLALPRVRLRRVPPLQQLQLLARLAQRRVGLGRVGERVVGPPLRLACLRLQSALHLGLLGTHLPLLRHAVGQRGQLAL